MIAWELKLALRRGRGNRGYRELFVALVYRNVDKWDALVTRGLEPWRSDMQEAVSNMTALVERLVALCRMDEAGEALPEAPSI